MPPKEAIEDFINGNNAPIEVYYKQWKAELFLVAYHYLRNKQDAEDALADCFEKLMNMNDDSRKLKFDQQKVELKPLLLVMLRNRCLDLIRSKVNRRRIQDNIFKSTKETSAHEEAIIIDKESFKRLCHSLKAKESQILKMHIDGHGHDEIASELTLSEKTIKNSISLTKKKVRLIWHKFMV